MATFWALPRQHLTHSPLLAPGVSCLSVCTCACASGWRAAYTYETARKKLCLRKKNSLAHNALLSKPTTLNAYIHLGTLPRVLLFETVTALTRSSRYTRNHVFSPHEMHSHVRYSADVYHVRACAPSERMHTHIQDASCCRLRCPEHRS
jgi:hypothetical protein